MPEIGVLQLRGSVRESEDSVGVAAWMESGSRVTVGWWDTFLETVWGSLLGVECERRVWLHVKSWWMKTRRT